MVMSRTLEIHEHIFPLHLSGDNERTTYYGQAVGNLP
jgi:hypothetical protein